MLARLINKIPRDWLVFMYKHMPFTRLKNALVYPAKLRNLRHLLLPCRGMAGRFASTPEKAYSRPAEVALIQCLCSFMKG
ncbi:hypothetical protein [Paenibacillus brasilensis]|uniref:Uncharacterized protein n=1 Tax=Paenibacillus brasilensis TaxID=128574 RepID=A0ABU0KZ46_9BACL|nr:hypothetical protein [Paenibacillus brasilensis]MDQ0494700.1 hypothetical protein [Paenibacillus brasilensis]